MENQGHSHVRHHSVTFSAGKQEKRTGMWGRDPRQIEQVCSRTQAEGRPGLEEHDLRHQASLLAAPDKEGKEQKKIFTAEAQRTQSLLTFSPIGRRRLEKKQPVGKGFLYENRIQDSESSIRKRELKNNIRYVTPAQAGVQNFLILLDFILRCGQLTMSVRRTGFPPSVYVCNYAGHGRERLRIGVVECWSAG
jgi:hypothetical protein